MGNTTNSATESGLVGRLTPVNVTGVREKAQLLNISTLFFIIKAKPVIAVMS